MSDDPREKPLDVTTVKQALIGAGVEIYRTRARELHVAERVRLHIMDSGVRVVVEEAARIMFTARSQRSDFPNVGAEDLFAKVRHSVGRDAVARGYAEATATTVEVKDPVDPTRVLDVWHEVTYAKQADALTELIDEVRWALAVEKYVAS